MIINKSFLKNDIVDEIDKYQEEVTKINEGIEKKNGKGNEFLGWTTLPTDYDKIEFARIKEAANKIQKESEVLLIIGIGGSYLGAKAIIDLLNETFYNQTANSKGLVEIYFVGQNMSSDYMKDLENLIKNKDFSINVISKSGTTTEPAIAFRHFKNILFQKYGNNANSRIYATTDGNSGALKEQATSNGWESFIVPDSVGGRFSVLTAVGLLPICTSGINIDDLMDGARIGLEKYSSPDLRQNAAYEYAVLRNILLKSGKNTEILVGYEPKLQYFNEWWKQLFGESEGKENKGIFPASAIFSTDLHSLGQYIQEGQRNLFETVINFKNFGHELTIKEEENDLDGLNYLANKKISYVNEKAFEATAKAHSEGGVPNIVLEIDQLNTKNIGELIYFFEKSCAMSGYLLGINPFDQPGVEAYKNKMFELLEKPKN